MTESFNEIPSGQLNNKLPSLKMQQILCSTDSNAIHLLAIDKGTLFDEIGELIQSLNKHCNFKTVQLSAIDMKQTKLQYNSGVNVFMVNTRESIHYFLQAVTRYQGSTSHHRFLVVFDFQYDLQLLKDTFQNLAQRTTFNIVVIMHDESVEISVTYNPFDKTFNSIDDAAIREEKQTDVFVRNRSDLRRRTLVVSMHEQIDRAVLKKNDGPGYTGVDGLIADLLEERYFTT